MLPRLSIKLLGLFAGVTLFAQTATPKPPSGESTNNAMPLPPTASLPTTVSPGPVIVREDLTPEQKEKMKEVDRMRTEKALIDAQLALQDAKRMEEIAPLNAEAMKLTAERALRVAKAAEEAAVLEEERIKLERQSALGLARSNARLVEKNNKIRELEAEAKQLQLEASNTVTRLTNEINRFQKEEEAKKIAANVKPKYLKDPYATGVLYISDRRIAFNGAVTEQLAEYICQRINFYNNQSSEFPIFIVVDYSPGGSVSAGYLIQKAMTASKSPVYVVVKGFAASMTAVIATCAERSFCYPNTIILHHQVSNSVKGNMTVLKEQIEFTKLWFERMATPVAKKMGLSLEDFVKKMYENDSTGDWQAFGEKAKELKWIDVVVDRIEETAVLDILATTPTVPAGPLKMGQPDLSGVVIKADANGRPVFELPALSNPFDAWWIYDPHGLYRTR